MFGLSSSSNDAQTRLIINRIDALEKHLIDIYNSLCSYNRKIARTRDEGDLLASQLIQFAESEKINSTMKSCLLNMADDISILQDSRHAKVQRLEIKVINEISHYGDLTRKAKEELKSNNLARNKFLSQTKESGKKPMDEVSTAQRAYEMQIGNFEAKKIADIKKIFLEFSKIELLYHVKGVEVLSRAYKHILAIDETSDLKEFYNFFQFTTVGSPGLSRRKSPSHSSLIDKNEVQTMPTLRRFNSTPSVMTPQKSNRDDTDEEDNEYTDDSTDNEAIQEEEKEREIPKSNTKNR